MGDSFKRTAATWTEVYDLTQEYLAHVEKQPDQTVRIFGYGSLIFSHDNEKQKSTLENENAVLKGAKVSLNLMAAGEGEYRGEYNTFPATDPRARRSTGVYMGMEQGTSDDLAKGKNITVELDKADKALAGLYKRELGDLPSGITYEDLFKKDNRKKFENIPDKENNLKLYKLSLVETEITTPENENKKVLSLAVPTNEKSVLAAVGRSPLEIAVMVAQGQGIARKVGEGTFGGDAIDYFKMVIDNFKKHDIEVPFMEKVGEALEKYLKYSSEMNKLIKSGFDKTRAPELETKERFAEIREKFEEVYHKSGLDEYSRLVQPQKSDSFEKPYYNSGLTSPFFHGGISDQLTKRDFTTEEHEAGIAKIPHTSKLAFERLAALYEKHFGTNELEKK